IYTSSGTNGQNAQPYLSVNGIIWELPTAGQRFSVSQDWTTLSVDLPLDSFTFPGTLDIAIGIRGFADTQFQTTGILSADNISLTLRTSRLAEVVDLGARDADQISNEKTFVTGSGENGYATFSGNWSDSVSLEFLSNETGTEFNLDLFMELEKNSLLDTNTYTVSNGTLALWESTFTAREMAFPFTYYYFNVTTPNDWTISTVYDAYNDLQLSGGTYYNATYYASEGILLCDVYGTGTTGTPHYGTWTISSTAPNYGDSMTFMGDSSGTWTEIADYYPDSALRVGILFSDVFSNPPTTSGTGSLEFYDLEGTKIYSEIGGALDVLGESTYQNGTGLDNITIQPLWLAGPVTAAAVWSNGTAVGVIHRQFNIYHHTELEIETDVYSAYRGDTVSVRVKYIDSETNLGIPGAELYFNWSYGSDAMGYAGNGWYAGYVDTSAAVIGGYPVTVNASKDYYDFSETGGITINIQERTTLYSPKNLQTPTTDYEIAWGNSKTIYIAYEDTIAMNPDTLTASPGTPASPDPSQAYTSNNDYATVSSIGNEISLIVETDSTAYDFVVADITTVTLKLEGRFSTSVNTGEVYVYNFTSSTWILVDGSYSPTIDTTITWKTTSPSDVISGSGIVRASIYASHSSSFTYDLDLVDFIAGRPIDDTVPTISITSDWPAQTVVGTQSGPIYNDTLNIWEITYNTAGVTPGEYTILIDASALGHQAKTLELTITVRAHHSRVTAVPPSETPWSWKTWVNVSITDTDNSSIVITEGNITQIEIDTPFGIQIFTSTDWLYGTGSGQATIAFWLNTSLWTANSYTLDVYVTTTGSGVSKYFDDSASILQVTVRPHDIGITASPPTQTPWGWKTNVTVSLTDLDNSTISVNPDNVTAIVVAGQIFTSADWSYANGVFSFFVDSVAWPISSQTYTVSVICIEIPVRYYKDRQGSVLITVREHTLSISAAALASTPWGAMTNVSITLIDADNFTLPVNEANVTQFVIGGQVFTSADWSFSSGTYYVLLDTSQWSIGTSGHIVTVDTNTVPDKFYQNGISSVTIQIRVHVLGVSVSPPSPTPWSWTTTISITIQDLDNIANIIDEANITQIIVDGNVFTASSWIYSSGKFTVLLDTSDWSIGSASYDIDVVTSSTPKVYNDGFSTVTLEIREHNMGISISLPSPTPWSWKTNISFTLIDLDNTSLLIDSANITQISIAGFIFTSSNWKYSAGVFTCTIDTSSWNIGSSSEIIVVTTSEVGYKFYGDVSSSVPIQIVSHSLAVEAIRPPATPYSEDTTVTIRIADLNNASLTIVEMNITQIDINGQIFTSADWTYSSGEFIVILTTDTWGIGSYALSVSVSTSGSGATKFYPDGTGSLTIDVRERYTEAYAPTPDPVPSGDNVTFYVEFRDRDASGMLVDATNLYLNDTDLTQGVDFWVVWISEGYYKVTMVTSGLSLGDNIVLATMERANYENATTTVRFRIRVTDTDAIASGYRFNVPLGTDAVFTVQFNDVDHSIGIPADSVVSNASLSWSFDYLGSGLYEITVITTDSTSLASYPIRFNFTAAGYEDAYINIVIVVEIHDSYLSLDEPVLPTPVASVIQVRLFYEDISTGTGISNSTSNITVSVWYTGSGSGFASFTAANNVALGTGHYTLSIPASQFGGTYTISFIVYFNWTGVAKYENLTRSFSVELTGADTDLSVAIAPQSVYFGDLINFTLLYQLTGGGAGIDDDGNVTAYAIVVTSGQSIDQSDFTITNTGGGNYKFLLDSALFSGSGSYLIRCYLNWTPTASPFYQNQTLALTVTILYRTTLLDVVPPQNTAFDENATFTFTYIDSADASLILNSTQMFVKLNNPAVTYFLEYNTGTWTVIVDTSSLGSTGAYSLQLNVTWIGLPFYQNQTRSVSLTVTERPTQLSYTPPVPTFFNSNVTIVLSFRDLLDDTTTGMSGGILTLSSAGLTLAGNYTVNDNTDGTYTVVLNTTAFLEPNSYPILAQIAYGGARYCSNAQVSFALQVLNRAILANADPIGNIAWQEDIGIVLHLTDGETTNFVTNTSGAVRIAVANQNATAPEITGLSVVWTPGTNTYTVSISNTLAVGTYLLFLNVSYDYTSPFYGYRIIQLTISIRMHSTELQLYEPAVNTGFGLNTTFQLYYIDLDNSSAITLASLSITNASLTGYWSIVEIGGGLYEVQLNTTVFATLGTYWIEVEAQNVGNLQDTTINVRIYVRERYTILSYDAVGTVGYTDDVIITVYYSDSDLASAPIVNGTPILTLTVNQTTYSVTAGVTPGSYVITMPANQFVAFAYTDVKIDMTSVGVPYYQDQSITVRFQTTGTSTEFAWDPSDPVPYGDLANVTFYWGDIDSGLPVACTLGVDTAITVVSITQPGLDTTNVTILNIVQGVDSGSYATFFLLLNTTYLDSYGTYEFRISIDWTDAGQTPYYQDQSNKLVTVTVRMRNTAVPQILVDSVAYGENATIRVQYVDLDNASLLVTGAQLDISVLDGLTYEVNPIPVGGFYEIKVVTEGTGLLGTIRINMTILWYGAPYFENQTSVTAFLTINMKVATMEITYPDVAPYLDNVTFYIHLRDSITLEYINNNESSISATFVSPSIVATPIITYVPDSDGTYLITFNSTELSQLGTYILTISFDHSGSSPYYTLLSRNVTGSVRARTTSLDYEPIPSQPYGNYTTFTVTYTDTDSSSIIDTGSVYVTCATSTDTLENGVNYWTLYLGAGVYRVNISTTALGAPATYTLKVVVNSTADWWLSESARNVNFVVSYRSVDLSVESPDTTYYGEVTFFIVTILDVDSGATGTGLTGMTSNIQLAFVIPSGLSTSSVSIVELTDGRYNVSFDTAILDELTDYRMDISFNAPNYWENAGPRSVTGRVSARPTQLSYDVAGAAPYLDNVTITFAFEDSLTSGGIGSGSIT
ncbi:MAG: hypothetical protein P1Q69_09745, partial [Candidatus Thorarchaeota archaeon]|nr:hypothetical protein [Candidatus Thorarchaeota archaeon]